MVVSIIMYTLKNADKDIMTSIIIKSNINILHLTFIKMIEKKDLGCVTLKHHQEHVIRAGRYIFCKEVRPPWFNFADTA